MATVRDHRADRSADRNLAMIKFPSLLIVIWLVIGGVAAGQRHYFSGSATNCAKDSRIAVTIIAGPLNYFGVNPKVHCHLPQPSK